MNFILLVKENEKKTTWFEFYINKNLFYFKVIASAGDETYKKVKSGEESSESSNDYTERRSLAISIPDYSVLEANNEKFVVSY